MVLGTIMMEAAYLLHLMLESSFTQMIYCVVKVGNNGRGFTSLAFAGVFDFHRMAAGHCVTQSI
jgi:hypothetical protein